MTCFHATETAERFNLGLIVVVLADRVVTASKLVTDITDSIHHTVREALLLLVIATAISGVTCALDGQRGLKAMLRAQCDYLQEHHQFR